MANNFAAKDGGGNTLTIRTTDIGGGIHAVHHVINDGSDHTMPAMDAVGRAGYFRLTDGTNTMPTGDVAARRIYVQATDGTNSMPAMDAVARPGFFKLTDGTNTAPTMDAAARAGFQKITDGTNTMPTGDVVARRIYFQHTDGTNSTPAMDSAARPGYVAHAAATTGGATPYQLISANTTNATSVKGLAGTVYGIQVNNVNAAVRYLKLYDKASAPTVGSDTPVKTISIPPGTVVNVPGGACGIAFANGIAFALTVEATVAGTTAVSANEHVVNIDYK